MPPQGRDAAGELGLLMLAVELLGIGACGWLLNL
jgi:hypothetical protein